MSVVFFGLTSAALVAADMNYLLPRSLTLVLAVANCVLCFFINRKAFK